jgi:hypothetical protein
LPPQEFDLEVRKFAKIIKRFYCLSDPGTGLRIKLIEPKDLKILEANTEPISKNLFKGVEVSTKSDAQYPGLLLSWWLTDIDIHPFEVTKTFITKLQESYKKGFGSRRVTQCLGLNLYVGERKSSQASSTFTTPIEDIKQSQYYRSEYTDLSRPFLEKNLRRLSDSVIKFARDADFLSGFLSGPKANTSCDITLTTCGAHLHTKYQFSVLGFVNTPHTDKCDVRFRQSDDCDGRLKEALELSSKENGFDSSHLDYIKKFGKEFGYAHPTTCAYQWVTEVEIDGFYCYFIFNNIGVCVRITSYVGHQFWAHVTTHHTSTCLVVVNGKVHFLSQQGLYNLFAWGGG